MANLITPQGMNYINNREYAIQEAINAVIQQYPGVEIIAYRYTPGDYIEIGVRKRGVVGENRFKMDNTFLATAAPLEIAKMIKDYVKTVYGTKRNIRAKVEEIKNSIQDTPSVSTGNSWTDDWIKKQGVKL